MIYKYKNSGVIKEFLYHLGNNKYLPYFPDIPGFSLWGDVIRKDEINVFYSLYTDIFEDV